jgi:D-alanyl-D-alanine carboxypeptidase (penicillin-binding protein 5/6)
MPELGERGVSYEAQMGPIYYVAAGAIARPTEELFGERAAFYAVRGAGLLLIIPVVALTYALALLVARRKAVALGAAAFIALNPSILAVASSVQNDYLAMALTLLPAFLAARAVTHRRYSGRLWFLLGVLIAIATLTKIFAAVLLFALAVATLVGLRTAIFSRIRLVAAAAAGFMVVCGWWFIRNLAIYGDLSGRAGLSRAGFSFPPLTFHGVRSLGSWLRSLISYIWVPTEYYRNAFDAPGVIRLGAVLATALLAVLTVIATARRHKPTHQLLIDYPVVFFLVTWFGVTFAAYTVTTWIWTVLAPRIVYVSLPGLVALTSLCATNALNGAQRFRFALAALLFTFIVGTAAFVLVEVSTIPTMPFWISFRS